MPEYVSFHWISNVYGIPLSSLYMYNAQGNGPRVTKIGRHYRVNVQDLQIWLDANTSN